MFQKAYQLDLSPFMKMKEGDLSSLMPSTLVYQIKENRTRTIVDGGAIPPAEFLHSPNDDVQLDRKNKTYTILSDSFRTNNTQSKNYSIRISKTKENAKILRYRCSKYIIYETIGDKTISHTFWITDKIKNVNMEGLSKARIDLLKQCLSYDLIKGIPLKVEMNSVDGSTMTLNVVEIKKELIDHTKFLIPADYTKKD